MRLGVLGILFALAVSACATPPEQRVPGAITFRSSRGFEFYDFALRVSHDGNGRTVRARDCSTDRYWCAGGVSVLIAPRRCNDLRQLIRGREDWRISDAIRAHFLFLSERQLYFASNSAASGSGGFVYDIELGVVGVWHSTAAPSADLDQAAINEIIASTKWLEAPRPLFACS